MLVTTAALLQAQGRRIRDELPELKHVFLVGDGGRADGSPAPHDLDSSCMAAPATTSRSRRPSPKTWRCCISPAAPPAGPRARSTSTRPCVAHHITGQYALDLHPDDIFWCTADPGWVTGTSYGIIAPLTNGVDHDRRRGRVRRRALVRASCRSRR